MVIPTGKNLRYRSAKELGCLIATGELDARDVAQHFMDAIDRHPAAEKIYARSCHERAEIEAEAAHLRACHGKRLSVLDGVPISWKDLFDTAQVPTEGGSALLHGRIPDHDAVLVKLASEAGLVCLGKTHMSELAYSGLGLNPVCETPPNVNGDNLAPGGSSSGAAASVAFGLAPVAIGSDTGGSIRIPAAWNDLVGFKPTYGQLPLGGALRLCNSFDTAGPIARSVEDASAVFSVLKGRPDRLFGMGLEGKRILILETVALDGLEQSISDSFERICKLLTDSGVFLETRQVPAVSASVDLAACVYGVEAYAEWQARIEAAPELMFKEVLARFRAGREFSGIDFVQAWNALYACRKEFVELVSGFDATLIPTSPILPPSREDLFADSAFFVQSNLLALRNTRIANLMGTPALTLPTGTPSAGVMLISRPGWDRHLLALGKTIETLIEDTHCD